MKFINAIWASQAKILNKFTNTIRKLYKTIANLYFNKTCKEKNLIPNYINVKTNTKTRNALESVTIAQKTWLNREIKLLYIKKNTINEQLYKLHLEAAHLFRNEWSLINNDIQIKLKTELDKKYVTLNKKIEKLLLKQNENEAKSHNHNHNIKFFPRVVNLSSPNLTPEENSILELGYKHDLTPHIIEKIKSITIDAETALAKYDLSQQESLRNQIANNLKKAYTTIDTPNNKNKELKTITSLNKKMKQNNIINTKADKGNSIILINKDDYIAKTLKFFNENNINEINKDPTEKYYNQIKKAIKTNDLILNDNERKSCLTMHPKPPSLKAQIKLHKKGEPIRPIVNFTKAPSYKISKKLAKLLQHKLELKNTYTLRNSIDLVNKIKNKN